MGQLQPDESGLIERRMSRQVGGLNSNDLRKGQSVENQWTSQSGEVRLEKGKPRSHNWP